MQAELEIGAFREPWRGDLDGMIERRVVRVLTVYGLGRYFIDGASHKGLTYEMFQRFERYLNEREGTGHLRIQVVMIPVNRRQLISGLLDGHGDIAAAGLTITPERDALVDFSAPVSKPIREVLVTGPSADALQSLDDLSGKRVAVRATSSYYTSLRALNETFARASKPFIEFDLVPEVLEDEDLLEMVDAGLLPWAVVDEYKADVWREVFPNLAVRSDLVVREGGRLGFAFRSDSPRLKAALDDFLESHREGTLTGNVLINRYFRDYDWAANALAKEDLGRLDVISAIFAKYGDLYDFDHLMVVAQGYQESKLDQRARSHTGAVGIMQVLPSTAADPNVAIADIHLADPNIHAGIKYLSFIRDRYFDDDAIGRENQTLLAFAAYNAGPARVQSLRKKALAQGLDPNVWFDNVEVVAAREIGRETVQYVSNIYKYYISYKMIARQGAMRDDARESLLAE